ncbi:Ig-like domain-containing protein [Kandleria vitulina]|uniref:Ig-like domain-containing protein n=2 Tax=Kandleria vitulina TaxID=1630 RepID=UPI00048E5028|nr:Ig-like domain-containing protein [Kandleria vitulina]
MKKKKTGRRVLSFLLTLAMVVGLMPGMVMTAYAETYDGMVHKLQAGDILEPGAEFDAMGKTIILQANGWCTSEEHGEITQGTENKTPENLHMLRVSSEDDSLGAIGDMPDAYFPYANGAKVEAWKVVSVEGGDEPWDSQTITLTGYADTQSNNPFASSVYYRQYDSTGTQMDNGTIAANTGILIENDTKKWVDGKTYIANGTVAIDSRVKVTGTVNLILLDGASLTINGGIAVKQDNTLNIYAGNTTSSISGSGKLTAAAGSWNAGIGSGSSDRGKTGTVNIHGGSITATGGDNGAGIGGGYGGVVNIYDGSVTANGGDGGAGIGGGYNRPGGTVTIYGGTVTATGGERGAGIGGGMHESGGTVSIYGGTVKAFGGNKPNWDNCSDSMGIGNGCYDSGDITAGTLTLGTGVSMSVSADKSTWSAYDGSTRAQYMKTGSASVAVTGVTLAPSDAQTVTVGESVAFTATITPENATDRKVKWSTTGGVTLYSDENCTAGNEIGADATSTLTVYAKGISAGSATVTATSNADSTKTASCAVTVTDPLADAKKSAKADLDTLQNGKNQNDYDAADWTTLTKAITDGKTAIDNATTTEAVTTAKNNAVDAVNAVKTKAQKELDNAKTSAVNTVNAVNANDYIAADQQTVTDAKTTALAAIEAATTEEEVTTALNNFNNAIASCTTQVVADQIAQVMSEVSAKTGSDMTYTGDPIQLINTPTTALPTGYTMKYVVTTEKVKPTDENLYTTSIPAKTNAGTYYVWYKVKADENHNDTDANYVEVSIGKRSVTLTSATASKTYDGTALTNTKVTVGGDGFVTGEGATYDVTGTRTVVGVSENTFTYTLKDNTKADNYDITPSFGTLTVTNRNTKYEVTLKANSGTEKYDGKEKTVSGYTIDGNAGEGTGKSAVTSFTASNGKTYTVTGMSAEVTGTNAGEYVVNVIGTPIVKDADGNDVTAQFAVSGESGKLTVTKSDSSGEVKAVSGLVYDGKAKALVTAGKTEGGTLMYRLGTDGKWQQDIPEATDAGTYKIYYYIKGDDNHMDDGSEKEPKGSVETTIKKATINLKSVTQKNNKVQISWTKVNEADGYDVYVQYCGSKAKKVAKTIKGNSTTKTSVAKINGKKINQKKNFHVKVYAYKMVNGKKKIIAKTITAHLAGTKSVKYTNPKALKLTKSTYSIKVGKTAKIKAKVTLKNSKKKLLPKSHAAKLRYKSSNTKIATVNKNGTIKGKKKGTCYIYVYTVNGLMKKVKVTVK